ncbi:hypothetical protein niasHS_002410 [Heterodera schachtii]|uniref:Protein farnesyltransferase subunit beta n=2 Tax=Heterodera TaxID=34509 RepID=A0ABD2KLB2_HETSC
MSENDVFVTPTVLEQNKIERLIADKRRNWAKAQGAELQRRLHIDYVLRSLSGLPAAYSGMDASRTWFCYWALHSLQMLGHKLDKHLLSKVVSFIGCCQTESGGYGGGPGQMPHLATTYASVMSLITIGTDEALASIDRKSLRNFILSMRQPNGSFTIHKEGESDVRAVYCALSVASICELPGQEQLFGDTAAWLTRCQTYEGGFGGEPNCEAHSGYTFCALASLALLRKVHLVNRDAAIRWLVNRQMSSEGGFQGRANKLVDGCYSYWNTACFSALDSSAVNDQSQFQPFSKLFDPLALQSYVLEACQAPSGGLRDKPDKSPDLYHTCYTLSGLSVSQIYSDGILSGNQNIVESVHPIYNVHIDAYSKAQRYFKA